MVGQPTDPADLPGDTPPAAPIPFATVVSVLADPTRQRILSQLATGEAMMVAKLAELTGATPDATSKHVAVLRNAGLVTVRRNRLYQLRADLLTDKAERVIDLGCCLLRLKAIA